jgi:hypothetical protein
MGGINYPHKKGGVAYKSGFKIPQIHARNIPQVYPIIESRGNIPHAGLFLSGGFAYNAVA